MKVISLIYNNNNNGMGMFVFIIYMPTYLSITQRYMRIILGVGSVCKSFGM